MYKPLSGKKVIRILCREFGFFIVSQKGSHVKLSARKSGPTTIVPLHKELAPGTLKGVLELAKVDTQEFWKNA